MNVLVGYTGFVGSNLYQYGQFDRVFNSKNIEEAYGLQPDLLVYAGLRAEKYLANHEPEKDMELILQAEKNIDRIAPKKIVLISTIDVFKNPVNVDETTLIDTEGLHPYGYNRYQLECWVRKHYPDALIIRLPALFGINLKKNFIYDFIHVIPTMLKEDKFLELSTKDSTLFEFYVQQDNGFYKCKELTNSEVNLLKQKFKKLDFTALNFTDSRAQYQFYPLQRLWNDIQIALNNDIRLWHPATEPISAGELYESLTSEIFVNEILEVVPCYNFLTIYAEIFGGKNGYIIPKSLLKKYLNEYIHGELNS